MATDLLKQYLAGHMEPVNAALGRACQRLPGPVRPVAAHIFGAGGKRLRPMLTLLAGGLLGYSGSRLTDLAITVEMLHAATLLHDDVLDNAGSRRGRTAAHLEFGVTRTILAGDAMLACANALVAEWKMPALCQCFSDATSMTAAGEILELDAQGRVDVSPDQYEEIVRGKTAWLLRASCGLGAIAGNASDAETGLICSYGENLGMAFQLVDDALDFAPAESTGKPCGGDLREGKLTWPIMLYRNSLNGAGKAAFDKAFCDGLFSAAETDAIARRIREGGYADDTRRHAQHYLDRAAAALAKLPDRPERGLLLDICAYVRDRQK